jgi:hypothetical protein
MIRRFSPALAVARSIGASAAGPAPRAIRAARVPQRSSCSPRPIVDTPIYFRRFYAEMERLFAT